MKNLYDEFEVCGALLIDNEPTPIFTNPVTGDLLYCDEMSGRNMMIGGISDTTARQGMNENALGAKLLQKAFGDDVTGIVYCDEHVIVFLGETLCEIRPFGKIKESTGKQYEIDLDIDAEE